MCSQLIIDFHVHCFPDDIAERAISALSETSCVTPRVNGTIRGIEASMETSGVEHSVLLSIATKPQQTFKINRWAAGIQSDRIIPFGSIHPDCSEWENELQMLHKAGIKGIKFHPEYQSFYVDDPKMFHIYEKAAELGLIMLFHAGGDIGLAPPYHCLPDRMRNVVRKFSGAKIVAAHMGGYDSWNDVEKYLAGEQLYFDTSYSLHMLGREQFLRIAAKHGYDRLLFATDSPWADQAEEVKRLAAMPLPPGEMEAVLGGNAARLLGLTC